jgi:hypothetical protein
VPSAVCLYLRVDVSVRMASTDTPGIPRGLIFPASQDATFLQDFLFSSKCNTEQDVSIFTGTFKVSYEENLGPLLSHFFGSIWL